MFGITRCIMRGASRQQLTSKRGRNHYKGTGSGPMGRHTKRGGYVIEWERVRSFVVPDLTDFKLLPYVSRSTQKTTGAFTAKDYFKKNEAATVEKIAS
ncbi:hypothetical protein BGZ80_005380 [Entomortierella chlamydospora]|uniref:Uncharacterized protein n=1 Tax=Entomortierella chlamydospora TaxID=101097 RepID=A0A9P6MKA5_9FUNG|nr:hypothetical protein BGZ79_011121 [Entomortierella chlamydospora]KAG0005848.1 hypothetical protein BGZ80_005380 [Entomortierella chlamydospora]